MSVPPITVGPDATSAEIIDCLLSNNISGVPVVDENDGVIGIVTEADLVLSVAYGNHDRRALALVAEIIEGHPAPWVDRLSANRARDLMTSDVVVVGPDDDIADAARRMLRRRCGRLPVVRDGRIVGIVSRHDILRHFDTATESCLA
jgi:CBS domain-containing protein